MYKITPFHYGSSTTKSLRSLLFNICEYAQQYSTQMPREHIFTCFNLDNFDYVGNTVVLANATIWTFITGFLFVCICAVCADWLENVLVFKAFEKEPTHTASYFVASLF